MAVPVLLTCDGLGEREWSKREKGKSLQFDPLVDCRGYKLQRNLGFDLWVRIAQEQIAPGHEIAAKACGEP
jgi:hypothetical protein